MTEQHREPSLRDKKLSALYRQTEKAEPSAQLDALIQSAAHDAVNKSQAEPARPVSHHHKPSWFALAAVIALVAIALPIMLDESEQVLFEPALTQRQQAPGKLSESDVGSMPSVADAVIAKPAIAPAAVSAPASEKASAPAPAMELQKISPEKKARRDRSMAIQAEQQLKQEKERERLETRALQSKQKAYSDQQTPALTKGADIQLEETSPVADDQPLPAQTWQQQIRLLLQNNQLEKATSELRALRETWPDFQVDPELLKQIGLLSDALPESAPQD